MKKTVYIVMGIIVVIAIGVGILASFDETDEPAEYTPQQRYDDLAKERDLAIIESQISQNLTPQQRDKIMQKYYRINSEILALQLEYDIKD